ncbi:MAG TPA: fluoride efflux transporter CrcB [Acidisarcina sp.]|nr:fluoride efflux transporter CrcB [Acidisarcina sp.]
MSKYLWVGIGGFAGSIARYALGVWVYSRMGTRFPYGTFVINISGCFLIGAILTVLDARIGLSPAWRLAIPIGFIGAYTTFSTFEYETIRLAQAGETQLALLNIALSTVVGYFAVWIGVMVGRVLA